MKWLMALSLVTLVACGGKDDSGHDHDHDGDHPALDLTGDPAAGATLFTTTCGLSTCHGADGAGAGSTAADLSSVVPTHDDAAIVDIIVNGSGDMIAINTLEDQQIADILAYLREEFP